MKMAQPIIQIQYVLINFIILSKAKNNKLFQHVKYFAS